MRTYNWACSTPHASHAIQSRILELRNLEPTPENYQRILDALELAVGFFRDERNKFQTEPDKFTQIIRLL